jgi:hypothetical protein
VSRKQVLIALGTSLSMLSPGMALGFSAVALPQLAIETTIEPFDEEKSSWFGKWTSILRGRPDIFRLALYVCVSSK